MIINVVVEGAKMHMDLLLVQRVNGRLMLLNQPKGNDLKENCPDAPAHPFHHKYGLRDDDFALYASAAISHEHPLICAKNDQKRLSSALIKVNPQKIKHTRYYVRLTADDIGHGLGFYLSEFKEHTLLKRGGAKSGKGVAFLETNAVGEKAREHYGCPSLRDLELDVRDEGIFSYQWIAYPHWKRRYAKDELMSTDLDRPSGMYYTALTLAAFDSLPFYQADSLEMPATPTWCQGPALRIAGGSQEPAMFFFWKTRWRLSYGVAQHRDQPRRAGAELDPRRSWGTCRRVVSSIAFTKLLLSGDVEENPGPSLRGMQRNSAGLTQAKRLALHKTLVEENVPFGHLSETKMSCAEASSFTIAGYRHHGVSRPSKGGGVSILVREDLPVEVGSSVVASIEYTHATIHLTEGLALSVTSAYFPPGRSFTESQLDALLTTSGPHPIGADAETHALAWDRAIPPDTRGDVLAQWCLDNDCVIQNTGESTRHTTRHGPSAPDVALSRECRIESWTANFSPDSDHYITLFDVVVGDDGEPLRFPRPRAPLYAWKKAKWSRFRQMSNAHCRKLPTQKMSVHKRERLLASAIRIATAAAIPRGGRYTAPFWTPELSEIESEIQQCKASVYRDRLAARRREMLRQASHERWKALCGKMAVADGCRWNIVKRIYAPCPPSTPAIKINNTVLTEKQKAKHFIRFYSTRARRHPHSHPPPPIPVVGEEFAPITEAELERAQRLLPKGTAAGPDGIYSEALQHLGPRAKAETLSLFNGSLRTGIVPATWKVGVIAPLPKPGKKATDLDSIRLLTLTSRMSKLMERIIAARIRDVTESKLTPQQSGFRSGHSTLNQLLHLRAALKETFM